MGIYLSVLLVSTFNMKTSYKRDKLIKALTDYHVDVNDWFEYVSCINDALLDYTITVDWFTSSADSWVIIAYYSLKLHTTIILEWDSYQTFENLSEMADYFIGYDKDAHKMERAIHYKPAR